MVIKASGIFPVTVDDEDSQHIIPINKPVPQEIFSSENKNKKMRSNINPRNHA